jgi:hypothetical protein
VQDVDPCGRATRQQVLFPALPAGLAKPQVSHMTLVRLDHWRRNLPMAWWLTYDSLVAIALILAFVRPWLGLVVGIPWLLLAAFIDTIEYLAKTGRIYPVPTVERQRLG